MKDFYSESHKMLKGNFNNLNKLKYVPCSWVKKLSVLLKLICRFKAIPNEIPVGFFCIEIDKFILKFFCKCMRPKIIGRTTLKKKKIEGLTLSEFKSYCEATVIKRA